jgi:hypothetical protein
MSNRQMTKANGLRNRGRKAGSRLQRRQPKLQIQALQLMPEYKGQPVVTHVVPGTPVKVTTTVTTGAIAQQIILQSSSILNFAARFIGYTEFRIIKATAKVASFSSTNPGLLNHWFTEDDGAAPTATRAQQAQARRFPASDIRENVISYRPLDPAQQTWSLVSSGAPVIGYYYLYTNNANYGSSIVATDYALIDMEYTVQFRGFI